MDELTQQDKDTIKACILFMTVLLELNMEKILKEGRWDWNIKEYNDENILLLKEFYCYAQTITFNSFLRYDDVEKLNLLKPLIELIKSNNSLLKENCLKNDWSKYITDNSKIQNSLKYLLSNLNSQGKNIMNHLAKNIDDI